MKTAHNGGCLSLPGFLTSTRLRQAVVGEKSLLPPHDSIQSGDEGEEIQEEESRMAGRRSESFRGLQNPTYKYPESKMKAKLAKSQLLAHSSHVANVSIC